MATKRTKPARPSASKAATPKTPRRKLARRPARAAAASPPPVTMDPRVDSLLRRLVAALEPAGVPYAVGGALAMQAYGVRRYTADVDAFVSESHRLEAMRALRAQGLQIMPVFAPFHYAAYDPAHGDPQLRIDLVFPADEPELSAIEFPDRACLGDVAVKVFPVTLLVIAKFYANRPKDRLDLAAMLEVGSFDPADARRVLASYDPEGAKQFEVFIAELMVPPRPRPRPPRR